MSTDVNSPIVEGVEAAEKDDPRFLLFVFVEPVDGGGGGSTAFENNRSSSISSNCMLSICIGLFLCCTRMSWNSDVRGGLVDCGE